LTYHGTADSLIPYRNTRAYYLSVERTVGYRAAKGVRYYEVPGMDHCAGGAGAGDIDWLHALDTWVESGRTPSALKAKHAADQDGPAFERPVCPYPEQAHLQHGPGNHGHAQYWACGVPK
jgi:feruloyl esterase